MDEYFDFNHIHTTPDHRHFRHGDGVEVDGNGEPMGTPTIMDPDDGLICSACGRGHHGLPCPHVIGSP